MLSKAGYPVAVFDVSASAFTVCFDFSGSSWNLMMHAERDQLLGIMIDIAKTSKEQSLQRDTLP